MPMTLLVKRSALVAALVLAACVGDDPVTPAGADPSSKGDDDDDSDSVDKSSDAGDSPSDASKPATTTKVDVAVLRNPAAPDHPAYNSMASVADLVVTGAKTVGSTHGFFAQHKSTPLWGGIFVFVGTATVTVAPGDVVSLTGLYKTYRGLDELDVSVQGGKIDVTSKTDVPAPLTVEPTEIMEGAAKALSLQSVLVEVNAVVVNKVQTTIDFTINKQNGTGDLVVTSYIANDSGTSPFAPSVGKTYSKIRGLVYHSGASDNMTEQKLAPASADDLVSP